MEEVERFGGWRAFASRTRPRARLRRRPLQGAALLLLRRWLRRAPRRPSVDRSPARPCTTLALHHTSAPAAPHGAWLGSNIAPARGALLWRRSGRCFGVNCSRSRTSSSRPRTSVRSGRFGLKPSLCLAPRHTLSCASRVAKKLCQRASNKATNTASSTGVDGSALGCARAGGTPM